MSRNVLAPNNRAADGVALAMEIARWNYKESVSRTAPKVLNWRNLTIEVVKELYIAREALNSQKGQRKDPDAEDYIEYNWSDYCEEIGLSRRTANNWLARFIPAEESETGEALLLEAPKANPDAQRSAEARQARDDRIAEYRATGVRPEGWTAEDELELSKRLHNERLHRMAKEIADRKITSLKPRMDYLASVEAHTRTGRRYRLDPDQQIMEADLQSTVKSFFLTFTDPEQRLRVAYNLTIAVKNIVNELTEYDYRMRDQKRRDEEAS